MSGHGAVISVEYDQVERVAGQLVGIADVLAAARAGAADLRAVSGSNPGFATVGAALACAQAWLDEVERLAGAVTTASTQVGNSLATYRDTDTAAQGCFATLDTGLGG